MSKSILGPGESLVRNDTAGESELLSANGTFRFVLQGDGNLVLYRTFDNKALWSSGTAGKAVKNVIMQGDGNLVMYDFSGNALWASNTAGRPGSFLVDQNDGNVVIYQPNAPIWATNTAQ